MLENLKSKTTLIIKPFFKLSLVLIMSLTFITVSTGKTYAQAGGSDLDGLVEDTKGDLLIVIGGGLAGAVLGLSTLSFVEEPKKHTRNIVVGASIGIIAGVVVVALEQATKSQELIYGTDPNYSSVLDSKSFNTAARTMWHSDSHSGYVDTTLSTTLKFFQYTLSY